MRSLAELRNMPPTQKDTRPAPWRVVADAQLDNIDVREALLAAGYSEEEATLFAEPLSDEPTCPICHDQGQLGKDAYCQCEVGQRMLAERLEVSRKESQIPQRYARFTWDTWQHELTDEQKAGKNLAFVAAWLFATSENHYFRIGECYPLLEMAIPRELESDPARNSLVLYGPYGTGKTGLMSAIANHLMSRKPLMYTRVNALVERVQETYEKTKKKPGSATRGDIINKASNIPVLLLDEFGGQNGSKDRRGIMEEIMRNRCAAELPFVATTNHTPESFAQEWDKRIAEVVLESAHWIPCAGPNIRLKAQMLKPI